MTHWLVKDIDNSVTVVTADNFSVSCDGLVFTNDGSKVAWFLRWASFIDMAKAHCTQGEQQES